ncbi:MAG: hypothetical protein JO063_08565, partial [Pseudonocardiales bacterium]|nr:hypothetical protein [Pseudonocardiales bacterium]
AATSRWLGVGAGAVEALGVRLVSVSRPGLGTSIPAPGRSFAEFAEDIRHLAARRGLRRPAMVGNSQGGPFALACAVAGLTGALALVSGTDEVAAGTRQAAVPCWASAPHRGGHADAHQPRTHEAPVRRGPS